MGNQLQPVNERHDCRARANIVRLNVVGSDYMECESLKKMLVLEPIVLFALANHSGASPCPRAMDRQHSSLRHFVRSLEGRSRSFRVYDRELEGCVAKVFM